MKIKKFRKPSTAPGGGGSIVATLKGAAPSGPSGPSSASWLHGPHGRASGSVEQQGGQSSPFDHRTLLGGALVIKHLHRRPPPPPNPHLGRSNYQMEVLATPSWREGGKHGCGLCKNPPP